MTKLFIHLTGSDHESLDKTAKALLDLLDNHSKEHGGYNIVVKPVKLDDAGRRLMNRRVELADPTFKMIGAFAQLDLTKNVDLEISELKN